MKPTPKFQEERSVQLPPLTRHNHRAAYVK